MIQYPRKAVIGASSQGLAAFPTPQYDKIVEMIDGINGGALGGNTGLILIGALFSADLNTLDDQPITFIDGSEFVTVDVLITNSSTDLSATLVDDVAFYTGTDRTGIEQATINAAQLGSLFNSNRFIDSSLGGMSVLNTGDLIQTLVFSVGTVAGVEATADIRIYGYKIS